MQAQQKVVFEIEREGRMYRFELPSDAPLVDAYQVAYECMCRILESIQASNEKMQQKEAQNPQEENNE